MLVLVHTKSTSGRGVAFQFNRHSFLGSAGSGIICAKSVPKEGFQNLNYHTFKVSTFFQCKNIFVKQEDILDSNLL